MEDYTIVSDRIESYQPLGKDSLTCSGQILTAPLTKPDHIVIFAYFYVSFDYG